MMFLHNVSRISAVAALCFACACPATVKAQLHSASAQTGKPQFAVTKDTDHVAPDVAHIAPAPVGAKTPAAAAPEEAGESAHGKDPNGAIKLHGHWVLQVKDADGTAGDRREFENSLDPSGGAGERVLLYLLSGALVEGSLGVYVSTDSSYAKLAAFPGGAFSGHFCGGATHCVFTGSAATAPAGIVVQGNVSNDFGGAFVVSSVATRFAGCANGHLSQTAIVVDPTVVSTVSPAACAAMSDANAAANGSGTESMNLTTATLDNPITVNPGQYLVVSVTLSFN